MNKLFILFLCLSFFNNVISLQLNVTFRDQYGPTQPDYINTLVSSGYIHTCSNGDKLIKVSFDDPLTRGVCAYSLANGTTEGVSGNSCFEYDCSSIPDAIQQPGVGCRVKSYSIDHESDVADSDPNGDPRPIDPNVDSAPARLGFDINTVSLYTTYIPIATFDEKQDQIASAKEDCETFEFNGETYDKLCYDYEIDGDRYTPGYDRESKCYDSTTTPAFCSGLIEAPRQNNPNSCEGGNHNKCIYSYGATENDPPTCGIKGWGNPANDPPCTRARHSSVTNPQNGQTYPVRNYDSDCDGYELHEADQVWAILFASRISDGYAPQGYHLVDKRSIHSGTVLPYKTGVGLGGSVYFDYGATENTVINALEMKNLNDALSYFDNEQDCLNFINNPNNQEQPNIFNNDGSYSCKLMSENVQCLRTKRDDIIHQAACKDYSYGFTNDINFCYCKPNVTQRIWDRRFVSIGVSPPPVLQCDSINTTQDEWEKK